MEQRAERRAGGVSRARVESAGNRIERGGCSVCRYAGPAASARASGTTSATDIDARLGRRRLCATGTTGTTGTTRAAGTTVATRIIRATGTTGTTGTTGASRASRAAGAARTTGTSRAPRGSSASGTTIASVPAFAAVATGAGRVFGVVKRRMEHQLE